ncbi:MAG: RusA family crossover junction endodeoxyribonuclease [Rhodospirillales bacterium]
MIATHGWKGSAACKVARFQDQVVVRFGTVTTRGGTLKQHMARLVRAHLRDMHPSFVDYSVKIWIEGTDLARRYDADNVAKACLDALNGVVWRDDRQVVQLLIEKTFGETPAITIHAQPFETAFAADQLALLMKRVEAI